jgi:predicted ATPase
VSIALAGAHRTGKSTLAAAFAKKEGFTYMPSRAGEAFATLGFRVGDTLTSEQRLTLQEKILNLHAADLRCHVAKPWIADRSALDMAAYMLLHAAGAPDCDHERIAGYVSRCFEVVNRHYGIIVLVQPGIPYVSAEGKPPPNPAQQEVLNLTLWGLLQDPRLEVRSAFLRRDVLDLKSRLTLIGQVLEMVLAEESQACEREVLH